MATGPPQTTVPAAVAAGPVQRTDGMAIGSLVVALFAVFGIIFDGVPGVVLGAIALGLGLFSRRRIKRSGGALGGGGLALAGWIVGACAMVLGAAVAVLFIGLFLGMMSTGGGKGGPPPGP